MVAIDPSRLSECGTYIRVKSGYMVHRQDPRRYQHRDVWMAANGAIPAGHHIHHKNKNKSDNRLENLECLSSQHHRCMHSNEPQNIAMLARVRESAPVRTLDCWACDKVFTTKSQLTVVKFCSPACSKKYNNWLNDAAKAARRAERREIEMECPQCNGKFIRRDMKQIYCGVPCEKAATSAKYHAKHAEQLASIQKKCPHCDSEFTPRMRSDQRFCSPRCARVVASRKYRQTHG